MWFWVGIAALLAAPVAVQHSRVAGVGVTNSTPRDPPPDYLGSARECTTVSVAEVDSFGVCRIFETNPRVMVPSLTPCEPRSPARKRFALKPIQFACTKQGLRVTPAPGDGAAVDLTLSADGEWGLGQLGAELEQLRSDEKADGRALSRSTQLYQTLALLSPAEPNEAFEALVHRARDAVRAQLVIHGRFRSALAELGTPAQCRARGDSCEWAQRLEDAQVSSSPVFLSEAVHVPLPEALQRARGPQLRWHQGQPCVAEENSARPRCLDMPTQTWADAPASWSPRLHREKFELPAGVQPVKALPGDGWLVVDHGHLAVAADCRTTELSKAKRASLELELEESFSLTSDPNFVVDSAASGVVALDDHEKFWPLRDRRGGVTLDFGVSADRRWLGVLSLDGHGDNELLLYELIRQP